MLRTRDGGLQTLHLDQTFSRFGGMGMGSYGRGGVGMGECGWWWMRGAIIVGLCE